VIRGNFTLVSRYLAAVHRQSQTSVLGGMAEDGINIVGFAKGELGIGEDARMAAGSCSSRDIPFVMYTPPFAIASRQEDSSFDEYIAEVPRYGANLIFLPGMETLHLFFSNGLGLFKGRFTIGAWQWELPYWPEQMRCALPLAQEFWASSRFTAEVMAQSAKTQVCHMPMAVELPRFTPLGRLAHGLPEEAFLFLYVFDGLSWPARKNPMGAIQAFQDTFTKDEKHVRFIVKTMNAAENMPIWRAVLAAAANDKRIILINEVYARVRLLSLYSCCDAYVSLHRSEGFGRTIAEAMLLEKPVIATAWSGNADFTTEETAFAVEGKMVPLKQDEYLFWEGQHWCEPDHDQAIAAMREVVFNPALARRKAVAARELILEQYSASAVGKRYRKRLEDIGVLSKTKNNRN
jgi:glycosyltransferase involved in cell wall biosynthesis